MEEENKTGGENKIGNFALKLKKNPYLLSTIVLGFIALVLLTLILKPGLTGNVVNGEDAGTKLVDYLNTLTGGGVGLIDVSEQDSFYKVTVSYQGQQIPVYVTKDGKYYTSQLSPITGQVTQTSQTEQEESKEVPKSDKPKVELFVMTYCPYGLQAEKGLIPVLKLLGDSVEGNIRFVHYFMHGDKEEQETYNQLCIREEQESKYLDYLECFAEDGGSERCLTKVGIDKTKLNSCLQGKAEDYYAEDAALSKQYGVQGSPTLIINEVEASSGRSPSSFLSTICSAFNTKPEECSSSASSESPSPGFGYSAPATDNSGGSCG